MDSILYVENLSMLAGIQIDENASTLTQGNFYRLSEHFGHPHP